MPEMAARTLRLCLPLQKIPREARLLQEAQTEIRFQEGRARPAAPPRAAQVPRPLSALRNRHRQLRHAKRA